eukprot:1161664-Pelagomonas_calceolata.AAC.22
MRRLPPLHDDACVKHPWPSFFLYLTGDLCSHTHPVTQGCPLPSLLVACMLRECVCARTADDMSETMQVPMTSKGCIGHSTQRLPYPLWPACFEQCLCARIAHDTCEEKQAPEVRVSMERLHAPLTPHHLGKPAQPIALQHTHTHHHSHTITATQLLFV